MSESSTRHSELRKITIDVAEHYVSGDGCDGCDVQLHLQLQLQLQFPGR